MKTILFVENDQVVVTMYRNRLESAGFSVRTAEDGVEAMKILSQSTPDLVTLDLMLPKLSGADVLKYIRAEPRLKKLPVILFSNAYMTELGDDAVLASANRRILKAYATPASLLDDINELLSAPPVELPPPVPQAEVAAPVAGAQVVVTGLEPGAREPVPAVPAAAARSEAVLAQVRDEFLRNARAEIGGIREHCRSYVKAPATAESQRHLARLHERVQALSAKAGHTDCARLAMLLKAFSALLSEVAAKPAWTSPSILQTIAQAADCVDLVLKSDDACSGPVNRGKVLVVDDDLVCNHVMVTSLKRANLEPVSVQNPKEGLRILQGDAFDAVLLDVNMPEMTGFEVCEQLRSLSHCKTTPVIFVTAYSNFQNRTQGVLSGGDDFITKPVSPLELALKVTIHMLKAHIERGGAPLPQAQPRPELSDRTLQAIAAVQIESLNSGQSAPPATENVPSPALTETATSSDATLPASGSPVALPPELDVSSLSPSQLAEAEFVAAQLASLTGATTETTTSSGAAEVPAAPAAVPEPVPVPVAAVEHETAAANSPSPSVAEWASAASEHAPSAADETVQQPVSAHSEPVTISELADALPATTESHNSVAETTSSVSETLPAAESAEPESTEEVLGTAGIVSPEQPGEAAPEETPATNIVWPETGSQNGAVAASVPLSEPAPSSVEPASAEELLPPAPSDQSNPPAGEAEPPAGIAAVLPSTESHNSLAEPASPSAEPPASEPGAPVVPEDVIQSATPVEPVEPAANQTESAAPAPVEIALPPTESQSRVAESEAAAADASSIVEPKVANVSEEPPRLEEPLNAENAEPKSPPSPIDESPAAGPQLLDSLDRLLFPSPDSAQAAQPGTDQSGDAGGAAEPAPAPEAPDDAIEAEANALSSDAESLTAGNEPEVAEEAHSPESSSELAAVPEDQPCYSGRAEPNPNFDKVVYQVTRMMYGEDNVTAMNLRLVRVALEHYKVHELVIKA